MMNFSQLLLIVLAVVPGGSGDGQNVRGAVQRFHLSERFEEPERRLRNHGLDPFPTTSTPLWGTRASFARLLQAPLLDWCRNGPIASFRIWPISFRSISQFQIRLCSFQVKCLLPIQVSLNIETNTQSIFFKYRITLYSFKANCLMCLYMLNDDTLGIELLLEC